MGEEFAIILPNTTAEGALQVAETIRDAVASIHFEWEGEAIPLTISIGVSADIVTHDQHSTKLLEQADKALYQAKTVGVIKSACICRIKQDQYLIRSQM